MDKLPETPLEAYMRQALDEAHGAVDNGKLMRTDDVHDILLDLRRALNRHTGR